MPYINTVTGQYPLTELGVRQAFPEVSFPTILSTPPEGYAVVFPTPKPPYNPITEAVAEVVPQLTVKGTYEQTWSVTQLSPEQVAANEAAELARLKALIPKSVTMRQARLALLENGLLDTVQQAIANMQGVEGDKARIEWEFSSAVERDKQLVLSLTSALNLTETQLDALFILANTL